MKSEYRQDQFVPSGKNLGGRTTIELRRRNHVLALINSQPTVNMYDPPKPHVDHNRNRKPQMTQQQIDDMAETFMRIKQVKGGMIDNAEPKTLKLKSSLSRKHSVQKHVQDTYHKNHVKAMVRNIKQIEQQSAKKIHQIQQVQRRVDMAKSIKKTSRGQFDTRSSHPLEAEWMALRPKSGYEHNRGKKEYRDTSFEDTPHTKLPSPSFERNPQMVTISPNNFTLEGDHPLLLDSMAFSKQETQLFQTSKKTQTFFKIDKDDDDGSNDEAYLDGLIIDEDMIESEIKKQVKSTNKQHTPQQEMLKKQTIPTEIYQIFDKQTQTFRNVTIPLIPPQNGGQLQRSVKRVIMQIVMDHKIFQRAQIMQIGKCLCQKNIWLKEDDVYDTCKEISRNLYGHEDD